MNGFGSFLNNDAPLPFDLNEFYRESPPPHESSIQVIHSQDQQKPTAPLNDFYSNLIPSKLEAYNPEMSFGGSYHAPPPLPPSGPAISNYNNNSSYMVAPPPPPVAYNPSEIDYNSGIPLPPLDSSVDEYSWNNWNSATVETPHSPPHFERKGLDRDIPEYIDESLRTITDSNDIDHRQMMVGGSENDLTGKGENKTKKIIQKKLKKTCFRC